MKTPDRLEVAFAMQKHGNTFEKALASLIIAADTGDIKKIKESWPDLWANYERIAADMNDWVRRRKT
jgi:hypothetical protein